MGLREILTRESLRDGHLVAILGVAIAEVSVHSELRKIPCTP